MGGSIMNWKKWSLLLALVFAMGMFLAACGGNDSADDKDTSDSGDNSNGGEGALADEQEFSMNIKTEPPSLHPGKATDSTSGAVLHQVFEGLTRINPEGEPEEAMAEEIDISDDELTYTFTIRDDATWSNGDPVTAEDFEFAWKWVLDPESPDTDYAYQLYPIKGAEEAKEDDGSLDDVGITVEDDKTLVVELDQPTEYFLDLTAFYTYFPVNKNVAEENDDWAQNAGENYVTNGPFLLDTWQHKNNIVLQKNTDYWDAETVNLETINMEMVDDESTELSMYESGELDWAGDPTGAIPLAAIPTLKDSGDLNIENKTGVYYYSFNTEEEPFDNENIRKAFALSLNRAGIVENITKGEQQPAMALVPPSIYEENEEGYFEDNDVEKAKEHLEKGLDELGLDKLPTIKLSYNTDEGHESIAQAAQDIWREELDVKVELNNEEWNVFLDSLSEGNYQMGRMGWIADFNDAINFLEIFETVGGNNYTNWEDEDFANLLKESRTETDVDARRDLLREAEEMFMDAMPIAPVYFYTNVWTNQDYVQDVDVSSLGVIQLKWAYIAEH